MKITQERIIKSLPKLIVFVIAFYNFTWVYLQTLDPMAGRGIGSLWFSTKDFPFAQLLLLLATILLFIPRIWSYSISVLISGYFAITWTWMLVNWFWTTDYSFTKKIEIITSQYFGHPLQIWESQLVLSLIIFVMAIYSLKKKNSIRTMP